MNRDPIRTILQQIQQGALSPEDALGQIKAYISEPLGDFAYLDHQRVFRTGFPEVIFAQGKTPSQVLEIFTRLAASVDQVLATRVSQELYQEIGERLPENTIYHPLARVLSLEKDPGREKKAGILIMTAGTSDIPVAEEAAITAELMGNTVKRVYDVGVAGLHRLANHIPAMQKARVIVVAAGMEGALPSVIGGLVAIPVIAVPTSTGYGASFQGLAALLGMLNSCASGVAVVNIDNGFGAGCLAAKINRLAEER